MKLPYIVFKWQLLITSLKREFLFFHLYIHLIFLISKVYYIVVEFPFFASLNIKRNIQNMHTHTKNVPIYFKNNLSNQRLEASASVDRIAFVDLCGIRSCQVIIKGNIQECSVLHKVYVLLRLIIYFNLNNFTNWNLHFQYFVLIL